MDNHQPSILIVDDTPQNFQYIGMILRKNGYAPIVTQSGLEALEFLKKEHVDLVLLDIMMPEMDGYEVCEKLKQCEQTRDIPVVFLTAKTETEDLVKGFQVGAVDYITKPFNAPELLTRIKTHITMQEMRRKMERHNIELERCVKEQTREIQESLENLKKTQDELIQSEKMAALGSIVAGVTHEINTPLGIAYTESSFLEEKSKELVALYRKGEMTRDDFESYLDILIETSAGIQRNLDMASAQVSSFKEVSVDQSSERKRTFHLKKYIEETLLNLRSLLKRTRHEVIINCADSLVVNSYPGVFSQIITNFVTNSLQHGLKNIEKGEIRFECTKTEETISLRYQDSGHGMNESTVKQIFDPFFTTKREEGGSGLGMYIVYNLVTQKLKGSIECISSPEHGVRFIITMPRGSEEEEEFGLD